jgi:hypothetical protein
MGSGDVVEIEISGIGTLRNYVVAEEEATLLPVLDPSIGELRSSREWSSKGDATDQRTQGRRT